VQFLEKNKTTGPALINAGIYLLRATILECVRTLPCSIETGISPTLAEERRLYGRECDGYFIDIGLPETLQQARREQAELAQGAATHAPSAFQSRPSRTASAASQTSAQRHRPQNTAAEPKSLILRMSLCNPGVT
jgi:NDP-sugar pyrophosphorylase family protein